jgi:hypothetical protein
MALMSRLRRSIALAVCSFVSTFLSGLPPLAASIAFFFAL